MNAFITDDNKRVQFENAVTAYAALLNATTVRPVDKASWTPLFRAIFNIIGWIAFAKGGFTGQDKCLAGLDKAWRSGFIDMIAAIPAPTPKYFPKKRRGFETTTPKPTPKPSPRHN